MGYWLPALPVEKSEEWGRMKTRSACRPDVTTASHKLAYCELKYLDLDDYDLDFSSNGVQRGFFLYYYLPGAHLELPCSLMCPTYVCMRCS